MPKAKHSRGRTRHGNRPSVQLAAGRLVAALEIDSRTFSALATIIANERSGVGFTPGTWSVGAETSIGRFTVLAVVPGRRVRASTVASGTAMVRHVRKTSYSRAHFICIRVNKCVHSSSIANI